MRLAAADPGGVEYFDVYSPLISQLYSQVYWKALPPAKLPAELVRKMAGRTLAIGPPLLRNHDLICLRPLSRLPSVCR